MGKATRPPVNEVVISVSFESQEKLLGHNALITLRGLVSEYSDTTEQLAYEMPSEPPTDLRTVRQRGVSDFRVLYPASDTNRRYWLTSPQDESRLLQVQSDYFAFNWRWRSEETRYPGFDNLQAEFVSCLKRLEAELMSAGGSSLAIRQIEVSYINLLTPDALWQDHRDFANVVNIEMPALGSAEYISMNFSKVLQQGDGFAGRVHSSIETSYMLDPKSELSLEDPLMVTELSPAISITNTVRSTRFKPQGVEAIVNFLPFAHDSATDAFKCLTTNRAREAWGIS